MNHSKLLPMVNHTLIIIMQAVSLLHHQLLRVFKKTLSLLFAFIRLIHGYSYPDQHVIGFILCLKLTSYNLVSRLKSYLIVFIAHPVVKKLERVGMFTSKTLIRMIVTRDILSSALNYLLVWLYYMSISILILLTNVNLITNGIMFIYLL